VKIKIVKYISNASCKLNSKFSNKLRTCLEKVNVEKVEGKIYIRNHKEPGVVNKFRPLVKNSLFKIENAIKEGILSNTRKNYTIKHKLEVT
jgi:hypothetical protein